QLASLDSPMESSPMRTESDEPMLNSAGSHASNTAGESNTGSETSPAPDTGGEQSTSADIGLVHTLEGGSASAQTARDAGGEPAASIAADAAGELMDINADSLTDSDADQDEQPGESGAHEQPGESEENNAMQPNAELLSIMDAQSERVGEYMDML